MKTLASYLKEIGATAVKPSISFTQENQYPFITCLIPSEIEGEKPSATTLYFSKNASDQISSDTDVISIIPKLFVTEVLSGPNRDQPRTKLTFNAPKYVDITSLWE